MGSGDLSLKVFRELFPAESTPGFILMVFGVSSLITLALVILRGVRINRRIVLGGILLGIPNFSAAYFILNVLQVYPGAIAFPLNNIGIIALSTLAGLFIWRERPRRRTWAALSLAVAAVVLLNL